MVNVTNGSGSIAQGRRAFLRRTESGFRPGDDQLGYRLKHVQCAADSQWLLVQSGYTLPLQFLFMH